MAGRQRDELPTSSEEEWATTDKQRAGARLHHCTEQSIEFMFASRFLHQDLPTEGSTCRLDLAKLNLEFRFVRVAQHGDWVEALGASSCSRPSCLAAKSVCVNTTPVAFPPGRFRLATKPVLTGSKPVVKTIGIAAVAALRASAARPFAPITTGCRRTSSAASSEMRSS